MMIFEEDGSQNDGVNEDACDEDKSIVEDLRQCTKQIVVGPTKYYHPTEEDGPEPLRGVEIIHRESHDSGGGGGVRFKGGDADVGGMSSDVLFFFF